jgi:hypothetical protein
LGTFCDNTSNNRPRDIGNSIHNDDFPNARATDIVVCKRFRKILGSSYAASSSWSSLDEAAVEGGEEGDIVTLMELCV